MNLESLTDQNALAHNPESHDSVDESSAQGPAVEEQSDQELTAPGLDEYLENGYGYQAPKRGEIRDGVIVDVRENGLVVDIGFKREGFVPGEDLERLDEEARAEIGVGTSVSVFVLRPENREGHPILSIHQARMYRDWVEAERMMESGELYEGEVAGYNRGGLIVKFGKIRGFVPASQVVGLPRRMRDDQRRNRMEAMIGEKVGLKIIEVDRMRRRLIFSQRRALRQWQEIQRERVMSELVEGDTRHGRVTSITSFGAFVDLGGADGLIHVSELSWSRVDNPRDVLKVGDEVDVYVLDVDRDRKRIALSLKKLQPDPWTLVEDHYTPGELVEGRVTRVLDFGAFIELDLGVEGLLHVSEMIGTPELSPSDIVHAGEKLLVKIIRIDSRRKRLALSAKQVRRSEWERWVAEQQAAPEAEEEVAEQPDALVDAEVAEEPSEAPEVEIVTAGAGGEELATAGAVLEAEVDEVAEEPSEAPKVEIVTPEAGGEELATADAVLEAEVDEVAEGPGEAPEVETVTAEAGVEEAPKADAVLEAEVDQVAEEPGEAPEVETAVAEAGAEEAPTAGAVLEAEVDQVAEEPGEAPEVETAIAEAGAEEAPTADAVSEAELDEVAEPSEAPEEAATAISESAPALVLDAETDA
jgi:small subunit ribosomal protein S1